MNKNVIYILTNPSFPQFVKIGFASDLQRRLKELNRSEALPYAFRAYAVYETSGKLTDVALHGLLDTLNPDLRTIETFNGKSRVREFFEMTPEEAYSILEAIARISGTEDRLHRVEPTGEQIQEEAAAEETRSEISARRKPFRFSMIGMKEGDTVYLITDNSITATVADDDRHVIYNNSRMSLSDLADMFVKTKYGVAGTLWFTTMSGGKDNLDQLRRQAEQDTKG